MLTYMLSFVRYDNSVHMIRKSVTPAIVSRLVVVIIQTNTRHTRATELCVASRVKKQMQNTAKQNHRGSVAFQDTRRGPEHLGLSMDLAHVCWSTSMIHVHKSMHSIQRLISKKTSEGTPHPSPPFPYNPLT